MTLALTLLLLPAAAQEMTSDNGMEIKILRRGTALMIMAPDDPRYGRKLPTVWIESTFPGGTATFTHRATFDCAAQQTTIVGEYVNGAHRIGEWRDVVPKTVDSWLYIQACFR